MSTGKFQHLFKPLKMAEMPGQEQFFKNTGNADINRWLNGRDHLDGVELNFSWGFYSGLGDWHTGQDPHVHPYAECLVFVGLDSAKMNYLGAEIEVPTLDGDEKLKVPAGTQPGRVFKLKHKGVPHLRRSGRGDQLVIVNVAIPEKLSKEQRELFEQLAKSLGTAVKPQERGFLDWLNETLGG